MKIEITMEEALMLDAMKTMRKIYKSGASNKVKEDIINDTFWSCNKLLDAREVK